MGSESSERRATKQTQASAAPPPEAAEHLPCPRCESTNTKFCYYNNYNSSQPRHFCKSCRRYWTHGGTLRDIPVGGGSRKNAKRSRISASSSSSTVGTSVDSRHVTTTTSPFMASLGGDQGGSLAFMADVRGGLNMCGGFTSLLNTQGPNGLLALGGFGLGVDDMGFGFGRAVWPFHGVNNHVGLGDGGGSVIGNTWQLESGEGGFV